MYVYSRFYPVRTIASLTGPEVFFNAKTKGVKGFGYTKTIHTSIVNGDIDRT